MWHSNLPSWVNNMNDRVTLAGFGVAVQTHVGNGWHVLLEEICLNDIKHLLHLTEDQDAVLRERPRG